MDKVRVRWFGEEHTARSTILVGVADQRGRAPKHVDSRNAPVNGPPRGPERLSERLDLIIVGKSAPGPLPRANAAALSVPGRTGDACLASVFSDRDRCSNARIHTGTSVHGCPQ